MEGVGVVVIEMPSIVLPENMYNLSYNSIGAVRKINWRECIPYTG